MDGLSWLAGDLGGGPWMDALGSRVTAKVTAGWTDWLRDDRGGGLWMDSVVSRVTATVTLTWPSWLAGDRGSYLGAPPLMDTSLRLEVCTRLPPGDYQIRYLPGSQTFDMAAQGGKPGWAPGDQSKGVWRGGR